MVNVLKQCRRELDDLPDEVKGDLADAVARLELGHSLSMPLSRPMPSPKTSEVRVTKSQKTLEIASAPAGKTAGIAPLFRGFFRGRKPLEQVFFAIAVADLACFRTSIGKGVHELRLRDRSGVYRVIYYLAGSSAIYLLHAFMKKKNHTPQQNIEIAKKRLREVAK
jgi:hypothetical protein